MGLMSILVSSGYSDGQDCDGQVPCLEGYIYRTVLYTCTACLPSKRSGNLQKKGQDSYSLGVDVVFWGCIGVLVMLSQL
jgi:hypothetical protein